MASRKITLQQVLVIMVMVTLLGARTMAQSDCTSVLITMSPCLDYVTGNTSTPTASCCFQFANVVQSQPLCLCMVLNGGGASLGVSINQTLALALPQLCHVKTPPASKCKDRSDGPATSISPGSSQGLPNDTPGGNSSTSGGSKANASIPGAVVLNMAVQFILLLLPIAFHSSSWTTIF